MPAFASLDLLHYVIRTTGRPKTRLSDKDIPKLMNVYRQCWRWKVVRSRKPVVASHPSRHGLLYYMQRGAETMCTMANITNPITGKPFAWNEYYAATDTLLVYGLASQHLQLLDNLAQTLSFKIFECRAIAEIIAIPSFMIVLNPKNIEDEAMTMLIEYWEHQHINECRILLTEIPHLHQEKPFPSCVQYSLDLFDDVERLRLQVLHQRTTTLKQSKRDRTDEKRILRIVGIQRELQRGLVKTKDLADRFQVSPRTIQRDIAILERLGELVSYDEREKAYFILDGESFF